MLAPPRAREAEPAGRGDGPPTPRRFFFHLFAGGVEAIDPHASSSTRSIGRCRATGPVRHHPVRRRADFFFTASPAVELIDGADRPARIAVDQVDGRCRASGSPSTAPLRRSTETGLLAALAPRFGGSADGADRSQKIARVNPLAHPLRARGGASRAWRWPTAAAPI